jgi:hypothetical protein
VSATRLRILTASALVLTRLALPCTGATAAAATTTVTPPPTAGSYCGQTISVIPQRSPAAVAAPLAVGDSVLYDAAEPLSQLGFQVNAMVCRTVQQGIAFLRQHRPNLPSLIVVALGTNGTVDGGDIETLLRILGADRRLALVTPHGGDDPAAADLYRAAARADPAHVEVLDWAALSAQQPGWFASDGIHLQGAGALAYAQLISTALVDLPASSATSTSPTSSTSSQTTATATSPTATAPAVPPVSSSTATAASSSLATTRTATTSAPAPAAGSWQRLAARGMLAACVAIARAWDVQLAAAGPSV